MTPYQARQKRIEILESAVSSPRTKELPHKDVMELILSYFLPESKLDAAATKMLQHFGTVACAVDADKYYLTQALDGNEEAAIFIKLLSLLGMYYRIDKLEGGRCLSDLNYITKYCSYRFALDKRECLLVILLDGALKMIGSEIIGEGDGTGVITDVEKLAQAIFKYDASAFILVHNHPSGDARPSDSDIELTSRAAELFKPFNKTLIEHIVISADSYFPIMQMMRNGKIKKKTTVSQDLRE